MATLQDILTLANKPRPPIMTQDANLSDLIPQQAAPASPDPSGLKDLISSPVVAPPLSDTDQRIATAKSNLTTAQNRLTQPFGSANNHPGVIGNILHGLSVAGQVAGGVVAPEILPFIPGTRANNRSKVSEAQGDLSAAEGTKSTELAQSQTQANTDYLEQKPEIALAGMQQKMAQTRVRADEAAAKAGLRPVEPEDGGPVKYVDDRESAAFQSRQIHDDVNQAKTQLDEANEEVKRASIDPNSPAYRLAVSKANTAKVNAGAAVTRAQAYYGNYLQHAYNKGLDGSVLPGAPIISDEGGNQTVVGSTNASNAIKSNAGASQFNDVHGSLDDVEKSALALSHSGGSFNSLGLTFAAQHLNSTPAKFAQSIAKEQMSPEERDYAIALNAAHERIQGMRKSAGGGATDSQVNNLLALLPDGSTPDVSYLLKQTGQIRKTADLIGKGAATAAGGLSIRGQQATPKAGAANTPKVRQFNPATGRLE